MAKKRKYKKRKQTNNINVAIIVTIIISILLAVLICLESEAGTMGQALSSFLGGMIGWLKYVLPFGMIVIAINLACKKKGYLSSKLTQYLMLIFFVSVVASIFNITPENLNQELSEVLKESYKVGAENAIGGGALGTLLAVPLVQNIGKVGSVILAIGASLVLFIFLLFRCNSIG